LVVKQPHKAKAPAPVAKPLSPQEQWEQQRHDYEIARAAYDTNERSEGFRWAQQNKIRLPRYCRAAEQRDPAFVEGCMGYLNRAQSRGSDRPQAAPATDAPDQG